MYLFLFFAEVMLNLQTIFHVVTAFTAQWEGLLHFIKQLPADFGNEVEGIE